MEAHPGNACSPLHVSLDSSPPGLVPRRHITPQREDQIPSGRRLSLFGQPVSRRPESRFRLAQHRFDQAMMHAFPVRRGAQVTTTTVTFSAIGQPQHITAPQDTVSYRQFLRPASPR